MHKKKTFRGFSSENIRDVFLFYKKIFFYKCTRSSFWLAIRKALGVI